MYCIELMLSQSLKKENPLLNLQRSDRRVLQIACRDLINFLKVHWKLVHDGNAEEKVNDRVQEYLDENPEELLEFVKIWSGIWMKKWLERVKLIIGEADHRRWRKASHTMKKADPFWSRFEGRFEMENVVIESLIKKGEICGTSILAENLLKMELGSCLEKHSHETESKQVVLALTKTLRKVKEVSRSKGPLIFVRVDKRYFSL